MDEREQFETIINRIIAQGKHTDDDLAKLRKLFSSDRSERLIQYGKNIVGRIDGEEIQIGDRLFMGWNDKAIDALLEQYKYLNLTEGCRDRDALNQYLQEVLQRLRQGCSDIRKDVVLGSRTFNYIARITAIELPTPLLNGFELPLGILNSRGDAFFMLSEFPSLQMETLQQFSSQCFKWAKEQVKVSAIVEAVLSAREPAHMCFAIAIVDRLDEKTRDAIRTKNPLHKMSDNLLWYQIPAVYELEGKRLYLYEKSSNVFENFSGSAVWDSLRKIMQKYLMPYTQEDD